ncbi:MAG: acyl carrier protein [Nitrosopumilus sp.]|nr:acyl carrier protein [Nitrosopumilus sp.]
MSEKKEVLKVIYDTVDEINLELDDDKKIDKSSSTALYGGSGTLDSFELVNFIVLLEEKIDDALQKIISLTDEKALSQKNSPFRTISSLEKYIIFLLEDNSN